MQATAERYLELMERLGSPAGGGDRIEVSLEELSACWFCTTRNAKLIVRKLVEDGLIVWHAGRGRGNRSHLTFLAERDSLLLQVSQQLAEKGEYKQAFEGINSHDPGGAVKERFVQWLNGHFGHDTEASDGNPAVHVLRIPVSANLDTLDPAEVYSAFEAHSVKQIFDQLVHYDAVSGQFLPELAHAWESNADMTEWTFYLRRGVTFHHGRELTSEDVRFTLDRLRESRANRWMVRGLKQVECAGPRTVRISLDRPNRIFLRYLSSSAMSIVPADLILEDEARFKQLPVGTGPFRVTAWSEERLELTANSEYYQGRAHLDRVVIAFIPEDSATALVGGERFPSALEVEEGAGASDPAEDWPTIEALSKGSMLISWNLRIPGPHHAIAFRRAIDLLVNRTEMIRELGEYRVYPSRGFRPTERTPLLKDRYDPESARRLLRESGYDGETLVLNTIGRYEPDARWIARQCAAFGIAIEVAVIPKKLVYDQDILQRAHAILFEVLIAREDVCEVENYEQEGHLLNAGLPPEMIRWAVEQIDLALATDRAEERRALLEGIEERLREDALVTFLLHKKLNTQVHPAVRGAGYNAHDWMDFKDIWIEPTVG
ncbi:ABC transporter substrate-binding protein [Cohnella nanjingensis]|uniref:SgrR family transcriptional regulator n=1 Tax=Cohnella nanjingensis TaxID=1387779 RepID=A0A7X0RMP4_9BACL|nr:ABC transporter substrate-binding protein [Cohnella nanjingensis]MBB6670353.1 SgrR family transcriptional regulator [Cohnella nanjingensis]